MAVTFRIEYRGAEAVRIRRTGSWHAGKHTVKPAANQWQLLAEQVETWLLFGITVNTVEFGTSSDTALYEVLEGLLTLFVEVQNREADEKLFALDIDGEPTGRPELPEPLEGFLYG